MKNIKIDAASLNQEFYQISPRILESFPKFRMPVNLYLFKENIASLQPLYKKETRLQEEERENIINLAKEGVVFVSRDDHPIYSMHISKQLDLILVDKNLTPTEIIDILKLAIPEKILEFYEQPVKPAWEQLKEDVLVLLEYVRQDPYRLKGLLKNLFTQTSEDLTKHTYNAGIIGLSILLNMSREFKEKEIIFITLGLFSYELGFYRIPKFIREKKSNLTPEEQQKLFNHPTTSANIMRKLDIREEPLLNCHLEHHEFLDGSGYPRKLSGQELSTAGRICSLANFSAELLAQGIQPIQLIEVLPSQSKKLDSKAYTGLLNILTDTFIK